MSYTALYRKYRPNNFANVVGQDVVVEVLKNSLKNGHVSHAYLFAGPRGTGKTSVAKIFAQAVNCQNFIDDVCGECSSCNFLKDNDSDIIEIDAASNNGVEEIRTIRDNVKLLPTFCNYKIYIIDEVHMLSTGAFNALLKTLEEPPSHVIFILATTDPNKIPVTILSRCQRFDFNKISMESLTNRLNFILNEENITLSKDVVEHISKCSDGGLRDAINLLDQALSLSAEDITISDIDKLCGKVSMNLIFEIFDYIFESNYVSLINLTNDISNDGKSYSDIISNMLILLRDYSINREVENYFDEEYSVKLNKYSFSSNILVRVSKILNELLTEIKNSSNQRMVFEIYLMHLIKVINTDEQLDGSYSQIEPEIKSKKEEINNEIEKKQTFEDQIVLEETSTDIVEKEDKKETNENLLNSNSIEDLKSIRINNVLFGANKDILKKILNDYDRVNDFISNKTYNTIAAVLLEGKVVVASDQYLLFAFADESYVTVFDANYKQIELFLNEIYGHSYKVVAVSESKWLEIRENFILNKKNNISYVFIDENDVQLEMSDNLGELENSALDIFGEDTISVK